MCSRPVCIIEQELALGFARSFCHWGGKFLEAKIYVCYVSVSETFVRNLCEMRCPKIKRPIFLLVMNYLTDADHFDEDAELTLIFQKRQIKGKQNY